MGILPVGWRPGPFPAALLIPLLVPVLGACGAGQEDQDGRGVLVVFAASSLRDVCPELGTAWEEGGGRPLRLHFAGSQVLGRQILAVGRADLFLSADGRELDRVQEAGLLAPRSRRPVLSNRLVVVVPRESAGDWEPFDPADLTRARRLALADPRAVPAGRYARAWLEGLGLWERVEARVAATSHVRGALALVESGAAPVGVVYATDAARAPHLAVVHRVPPGEGPPIVYAGAALASAPAEAGAFLDFLTGPGARAIFEAHGFGAPPPGPDDS